MLFSGTKEQQGVRPKLAHNRVRLNTPKLSGARGPHRRSRGMHSAARPRERNADRTDAGWMCGPQSASSRDRFRCERTRAGEIPYKSEWFLLTDEAIFPFSLHKEFHRFRWLAQMMTPPASKRMLPPLRRKHLAARGVECFSSLESLNGMRNSVHPFAGIQPRPCTEEGKSKAVKKRWMEKNKTKKKSHAASAESAADIRARIRAPVYGWSRTRTPQSDAADGSVSSANGIHAQMHSTAPGPMLMDAIGG